LHDLYEKWGINRYPALCPCVLVRRLRVVREEMSHLHQTNERICSRLFKLSKKMGNCSFFFLQTTNLNLVSSNVTYHLLGTSSLLYFPLSASFSFNLANCFHIFFLTSPFFVIFSIFYDLVPSTMFLMERLNCVAFDFFFRNNDCIRVSTDRFFFSRRVRCFLDVFIQIDTIKSSTPFFSFDTVFPLPRYAFQFQSDHCVHSSNPRWDFLLPLLFIFFSIVPEF